MNFLYSFAVFFILQWMFCDGKDVTLTSVQRLLNESNGNTALNSTDGQKFATKVILPSKIHKDEVLKVQFSVYNSPITNENIQVDIDVDNADIMIEETLTESNTKCRTFFNQSQTSFTKILASSMSDWHYFWVKPRHLGVMAIKIIATADSSQDEVVKVMNVENRRDYKELTTGSSFLINLNAGETFERSLSIKLPENADNVEAYAVFSSNLLDTADVYLNKMSNGIMGYIEHKLDKFYSYYTIANYLLSRHQEVPKKYHNEILEGYQEALKFLKSLTKENVNVPLMTHWIHAYGISAVIDSRKFIEVDNVEVERSLDLIAAKQCEDGSFYDKPIDLVRREMGSQSAQRFITTAEIILVFIKYFKYSGKNKEVIDKALNYLNASKSDLVDDYEKVIVAYTFDVYGDQGTSEFLISNLKNDFLRLPKHKKDMSMFVETASYLIMLKISQNKDPKVEVDWLLNQRNLDGSFYSSYDSVLAMEALSKYSSFIGNIETNLSFNIENFNGNIDSKMESIKIQIDPKDQHDIKVTGVGFGYVNKFYKYSVEIDKNALTNYQESFSIDVKTTEKEDDMLEIEVDVKLIAEGINETNLVMIEIEMPRGYEYSNHTHFEYIEQFEHKNDRTLAIFYIDIMYVDVLYKEVIQAVRVYEIENPVDSIIKVYDYYQPNIKDEIYYKHDQSLEDCNKIAND